MEGLPPTPMGLLNSVRCVHDYELHKLVKSNYM